MELFATSLPWAAMRHCKGSAMRDQRTLPQLRARRERRRQVAGMIVVEILFAMVAYGWHHFYGAFA